MRMRRKMRLMVMKVFLDEEEGQWLKDPWERMISNDGEGDDAIQGLDA